MALPPDHAGGSFNDYMRSLLPSSTPVVKADESPKPKPSPPPPVSKKKSKEQLEDSEGRGRVPACARCRRHKKKCDEGRPCRNCSKKKNDGSDKQRCDDCDPALAVQEGNAQALVRAQQLIVRNVHRPMPFRFRKVEIPDMALPVSQALSKREFLAKQIAGGVLMSMETTLNIAKRMPDALVDAVIDGLEAMRIVTLDAQESALGPHVPENTGTDDKVVIVPATAGRTFTLEVLDDDACDHPFSRELFDLKEMRLAGLQFNRKFAREIIGIDEDELLARMSSAEFFLPMPEVEFITSILDGMTSAIHNQAGPVKTFQCMSPGMMIGAKGGGRPENVTNGLLVRSETTVTVDENGIAHSAVVMQPVPPEIYDEQRLSTPDRCRPFFADIGDLRSGRQLLEDRADDNALTFETLQQSARGQRMLRDLTSAIKTRFQPFHYIASQRASAASSPANHSARVSPVPTDASNPSPVGTPDASYGTQNDSAFTSANTTPVPQAMPQAGAADYSSSMPAQAVPHGFQAVPQWVDPQGAPTPETWQQSGAGQSQDIAGADHWQQGRYTQAAGEWAGGPAGYGYEPPAHNFGGYAQAGGQAEPNSWYGYQTGTTEAREVEVKVSDSNVYGTGMASGQVMAVETVWGGQASAGRVQEIPDTQWDAGAGYAQDTAVYSAPGDGGYGGAAGVYSGAPDAGGGVYGSDNGGMYGGAGNAAGAYPDQATYTGPTDTGVGAGYSGTGYSGTVDPSSVGEAYSGRAEGVYGAVGLGNEWQGGVPAAGSESAVPQAPGGGGVGQGFEYERRASGMQFDAERRASEFDYGMGQADVDFLARETSDPLAGDGAQTQTWWEGA